MIALATKRMQGRIGMAGRVLIYDGIAANRIVLRCKLSAACYDVVQVDSYAELLHRATEDPADLVICDMDEAPNRALALCRALCGGLESLRVPVVLIGSDPPPALRIAAFRAGAWALLRKPLHDDLLLATLRQVLRQAHGVTECVRQQASVAELGFAEPPAPFAAPRRSVAIVGDDQALADATMLRLKGRLAAVDLHAFTPDMALSRADRMRAPETYVIISGRHGWQRGLRLVSDLSSRAGSRDSRILMVFDDGHGDGRDPDEDIDLAMRAAMALDLGADDVLFGEVHLSELAIRMEQQAARKQFVDALRRTLQNGIEMAVRDPLTGLYNRRYAVPRLDRMLQGARERGAPLALMALDLDRFKAVNDTHGHCAGDAVLMEVARRLAAALRPRDLIARSGGEEFWIALPDTGPADAATTAQALCRLIRSNPVPLPGRGGLLRVTVSIGVAVAGLTAVAPTLDGLLARADSALYAAKADGRDKVNFASQAA
jgi:two-component system cell cycle response regulator